MDENTSPRSTEGREPRRGLVLRLSLVLNAVLLVLALGAVVYKFTDVKVYLQSLAGAPMRTTPGTSRLPLRSASCPG